MRKIALGVLMFIFYQGFVFCVNGQNKQEEKPPQIEKLDYASVKIDFDTTSPPNDDFTKDIISLLETTHALNLGHQFAEIMEGPKKNNLTESQNEYYTRLLNSFTTGEGKKLITDQFVKIYRSGFTREEIKQLLTFYQTPIGMKIIDTMPQVLKEAADVGGRIGKYLGQKIYIDMLNENKIK